MRTFANELGIDTMHPQPGDTELLDAHQLDLQRREAEVKADVEREYGKIPEQEQLVKVVQLPVVRERSLDRVHARAAPPGA